LAYADLAIIESIHCRDESNCKVDCAICNDGIVVDDDDADEEEEEEEEEYNRYG
jgi:hypothetical protein